MLMGGRMAPFNELLRKHREAAGFTQEHVARATGLSLSAISKLEQRDMDPSWSTVQRVAKALGVSPLVFVDEDLTIDTPAPRSRQKSRK
jgi:transcriptional regulator with XRE-family HTH domain